MASGPRTPWRMSPRLAAPIRATLPRSPLGPRGLGGCSRTPHPRCASRRTACCRPSPRWRAPGGAGAPLRRPLCSSRHRRWLWRHPDLPARPRRPAGRRRRGGEQHLQRTPAGCGARTQRSCPRPAHDSPPAPKLRPAPLSGPGRARGPPGGPLAGHHVAQAAAAGSCANRGLCGPRLCGRRSGPRCSPTSAAGLHGPGRRALGERPGPGARGALTGSLRNRPARPPRGVGWWSGRPAAGPSSSAMQTRRPSVAGTMSKADAGMVASGLAPSCGWPLALARQGWAPATPAGFAPRRGAPSVPDGPSPRARVALPGRRGMAHGHEPDRPSVAPGGSNSGVLAG